jgi:hypothetical protein
MQNEAKKGFETTNEQYKYYDNQIAILRVIRLLNNELLRQSELLTCDLGRSEQLACPECENPYPHGHVDGSYSCEDCGNKWAS